MSPLWIDGYVLFIGMCVGSFLNVCIYRLPEGASIVRPPSACPKCGAFGQTVNADIQETADTHSDKEHITVDP